MVKRRPAKHGICKLCLHDKRLLLSHLIPKSVYGLCRAPGGRNPNPVLLTHEFVMQTSRQVRDHLLCFDCEQLLREKGEDWVIPRLAAYGGAFPLATAVTRITPYLSDPDLTAYVLTGASDIEVDDLIHFAMGIFWKASVHPWYRKNAKPWIDLRTGSNEVRRFLLGEALFPQDMALSAILLPMPVKLITFHLPFETVADKAQTFQLYIAGVQFTLWVGSDIPLEIRVANLSSKPNPLVLIADLSDLIGKRFREVYLKVRRSQELHPRTER